MKQLKQDDIPQISEQDLLDTIAQSKLRFRQAPIQKQEVKLFPQMKLILHYHFPQIFLLQCLLSIVFILSISQFYSYLSNENLIVFLVIGGVLFSMITSFEILRNRMMDMWETERACCIRMETIIAIKLFLLTLSTFCLLGCLILFIQFSQIHIELNQVILSLMLPYMVITTCMVQFKAYLQHIQVILAMFLGLTMFFIAVFMTPVCSQFMFTYSTTILSLCFIICIFLNIFNLKQRES